MTAATHIRPVPNDLPVYPVGAHERLDGNSFVKWNTSRWLASRTFKLMAMTVQGYHRALFDLCQMETPVGTLPDDDAELAFMMRVECRQIAEWRRLEFGPLRNWTPCLCDGRVRLMHPIVLEQVQDALQRREMAQLSTEQKAVAMRLDRLRKALLAEGLSKQAVADDVLIARMDEWLTASHGRRSASVYRSALLFAVQNRWVGREALNSG